MSKKADLEGAVKVHCSKMYQQAVKQYQKKYNEILHFDACMDFGPSKRNQLWKDALALCGSPYHWMSRNNWSEQAWKFLAQFTKGEQHERI